MGSRGRILIRDKIELEGRGTEGKGRRCEEVALIVLLACMPLYLLFKKVNIQRFALYLMCS